MERMKRKPNLRYLLLMLVVGCFFSQLKASSNSVSVEYVNV